MPSMFKKSSCLIFILLCLQTSSYASGTEKSEWISNQLCPKFSGVFFWNHSDAPQYVFYHLMHIIPDENSVVATGQGSYMSGGTLTFIKVRWRIDSDNFNITISESEPTEPDFVTDGTYEGTISWDLLKVRTKWETRSTGQTGVLELEADKSCQPLNVS